MTDNVERAVATYMATDSNNELVYIAQEIQNGSTSLLALVKSLRDYLTSEDDPIRVKGVTLLAEVIAKLPDTSFNTQSTKVLSGFFISKMDTVDEVIPALKGLLRLTSMTAFTAQECKDTVEGLFQLNMRSHVQSTRHVVFLIIDSLMARHRSTLQSLGSTFVKGYIALADGEKDPRNLLVAFALDRVLLLEFDISDYIEQLYDITFCYFPITFKAPANDPYGVTGDDLVAALRGSLSASPLLGPLGMPLFIEKLNAGTPDTKKDTMHTIAVCLPVYGKAVSESFGDKLWDGLKIEIFQPVDPAVQDGALEVMKVLVQTCHPDGVLSEGIGLRILRGCLETLKEPQTTRGQAAMKVVTALIGSSAEIATNVLDQLIPQMMTAYDGAEDSTSRSGILIALSSVLEARRAVEWSISPDQATDPLVKYKDAILSRFVSGLQTPSLTGPSLSCLHQIIQLPLLTKEELTYVVHNVTEALIQARTAEDDLTTEITDVLVTLSNLSPSLVEEITLQTLLALLPENPPTKADTELQAICIHVLSTFENLCIQPDLFSWLIVRLLTKIELLVGRRYEEQDDAMDEEYDVKEAVSFIHAMFKTIYNTLDTKVERADQDISKYIDPFVPRLNYLFFDAALLKHNPVGSNATLIEDASKIISLIVASLNQDRQRVWTNASFDAFLGGKLGLIAFGHETIPETAVFNPLEKSETPSHDRLSPLFAAALVGLYPETPIPVPNLNGFLQNLLDRALISDPVKRGSLGRLMGSILNKHANECAEFVNNVLDNFWTTQVVDSTREAGQRILALELWSLAVQALVVRNHPSSLSLARRLFDLFGDEALAPHAAKSLGLLPHLGESVLTKRNHAIVRLLYAQRLFGAIAPEIRDASIPVLNSNKSHAYLTAISTLIPSIPKGTYSQAVASLFPLLLRGLELPDPSLRANVVDSLVAIVESDGDSSGLETINSHLGTLVAAMLRNTRVQRHQQSVVRLKCVALRFLAALPAKVKQEDIQPYKAQVLRELQVVLDDSSKKVRRDAVIARSKWYKHGG